MLDKKTIMKELEKVMDPELGVPITEMELVDKVEIKDGEVSIDFHLTAPYCPPMLALKMAYDIKGVVLQIPGVKSVKLNMSGHYISAELNREVNK
ncbi:MAG: iron-sulfur cluster assembly protein [Candidatus Aenigmarchaeota archaeon]|nr:iron-sulfur cluster assembly protein [Candidatus Aenigmarchaeota archaeon]